MFSNWLLLVKLNQIHRRQNWLSIFSDEICFHIHVRGKSLRDRNLIRNYFNRRVLVASGLKRSEGAISFSKKPNELCDRICLIIHEKHAAKDTKRFDDESLVMVDKLLEKNALLPVHTKMIWQTFHLWNFFDLMTLFLDQVL